MARRRKLLKDETKKFKEFQDTTRRIAGPDRKVTQQDKDDARQKKEDFLQWRKMKSERTQEPTAPQKRPGAVKAAKPAKTATKVPTRLRGVVKAAKPASGRNKATLITNKKEENK